MKKGSKFLSLLLVLTIVFSSFSFVFADGGQAQAKDIASDWAVEHLMEAQIQELASEGYFAQFKEGVTRVELANFATTLYEKLSGKEITPISTNPFKDTEDVNVLKALSLKLMAGEGKDLFKPDEIVTREDVAVVIYNVISVCEPKVDLGSSKELKHKDIKNISKANLDKVSVLVSNDIMDGKGPDKLALEHICTREEVLVLFARAYDFVIHKTGRDSKGFLWEVSNGKNSVYVLGSVHVADSSIYPFSQSIIETFNKSDVLAVEANIVGDQEGLQYMMEKAIYTDDNTLEKNVPEEIYKAFVDKISAAGLDPKDFEKIKPWYAGLLVQGLDMQSASLDATMGIDFNLMTKAMFANKEILEIEGIKFQADLFDSMSKELQISLLESSLVEVKENDESVNVQGEVIKYILDAWKKGDMVEFEKFMEKTNQEGNQEFNNMLFNKRNENMSNKVEEFLNSEDGKTYFVVVGAGHLVGDTGIINSMKQRGYTVKQITK